MHKSKNFSISVVVYKIYDGNNFDKLFEVLSTLKNKKLKINNTLFEKYKKMLENPKIEQNHCSITSNGMYKTGHGIIRLMKGICFYNRSYYWNINY